MLFKELCTGAENTFQRLSPTKENNQVSSSQEVGGVALSEWKLSFVMEALFTWDVSWRLGSQEGDKTLENEPQAVALSLREDNEL